MFSVPTHELKSPSSPRRRTRLATTTAATGSRTAKQTDKDVNRNNDQGDDKDPASDHEGDDEEKDDPMVIPSSRKWNAHKAFASYLKLAHQQGRLPISISPYDEDEDEEEEETNERDGMHPLDFTPGLTHSRASSPISSSSDFPTSPLVSSHESISIASSLPQAPSFPMSAFGCTPAPPQAQWQRLRIERVSKRMERLKKGEWMCARDEDLEEENPVDELAEDGGDKPFVRPVLKPGEVWDPFGDEDEI